MTFTFNPEYENRIKDKEPIKQLINTLFSNFLRLEDTKQKIVKKEANIVGFDIRATNKYYIFLHEDDIMPHIEVVKDIPKCMIIILSKEQVIYGYFYYAVKDDDFMYAMTEIYPSDVKPYVQYNLII